MTDSSHDDDFEAYLKRRLPIQRGLAPVDHLEPPAELDRIVIGKARQAIRPSPEMKVFRAPRWALAVGLGTTLVLLLAVGLRVELRTRPAMRVQVESKVAATSGGAADRPAPLAPADSALFEAAPAAANAMKPASAPPASASAARAVAPSHPAAASWLAAIQKLRAEGRTDEAERELRRFRDAYPDYPLPPVAPSADGRAQ